MASTSTSYFPSYPTFSQHGEQRSNMNNASVAYTASADHDHDPYTTGSRKRARADTSTSATTSPYMYSRGWTDLGASTGSLGAASPAPLAATRYRLVGGLDTPTRGIATQYENMEPQPEDDFRRTRWTSSNRDEAHGVQSVTIGALNHESNGRRRGRIFEETGQESWGRFVVSTVTGLAGKVWNFCSTAASFQGFSSGGGDRYIMTSSGSLRRTSRNYSWGTGGSVSDAQTPIPGQYPSDDGVGEAWGSGSEEKRPAKRLQTSRDDWVMVEGPKARNASYCHASPSHRSQVSRPPLRSGVSRRSKASAVRLSSYTNVQTPQWTPNHQRNASIAGTRSPASGSAPASVAGATTAITPPHLDRSPAAALIDEDVQRYSAKRKRELKQTDASMKRLNDQLQMMIQQGKDALNSKVEVELAHGQSDSHGGRGYEDEGFVDGESDFSRTEKVW